MHGLNKGAHMREFYIRLFQVFQAPTDYFFPNRPSSLEGVPRLSEMPERPGPPQST